MTKITPDPIDDQDDKDDENEVDDHDAKGDDDSPIIGRMDQGDGPVFADEVVPFPTDAMSLNLSDTGNAERLISRFGDDLRFCSPWDSWLIWDGRRWQRDIDGVVHQHAKTTIRAIFREAQYEDDDERRSAVAKWAAKSEAEIRRRAMVKLAQTENGIPIRPEAFDVDPMALTVNNGTLLLKSGEVIPHDRSLLSSKLAPVTYNPRAKCPLWLAFLDRIMDGNHELISYLQRCVGYSLTGDTTEQCFFILHGMGGNGKSKFIDVISALLGDYADQASFNTFVVRKSEGPRNDIADLSGARFVSAIEADQGAVLSEPVVKLLTGGDLVKVRFLYAEHFTFRPTFKVWLSANHKPVIVGTDHSIWRRVHLIPFSVKITEEERDRHILDKLLRELPGVLNWALEGCREWQASGLQVPEIVTSATSNYRTDQDVLGQFIEDRCTTNPGCTVPYAELYKSYCQWAREQLEKPIHNRAFANRLTERGYDSYKDGGNRMRVGIALKENG